MISLCIQFYHHYKAQHWMLEYFCSQHDINHQNIVYDSLEHHFLNKRVLEKFMGTLNTSIKYAKVKHQQDVESCELFVIAWAMDVTFGYILKNSMYIKEEIQQHLWWCL